MTTANSDAINVQINAESEAMQVQLETEPEAMRVQLRIDPELLKVQLKSFAGPKGEPGEQGPVGATGPKGDTGATPQISVEVATGEPGSEAQASVTGTAEAPVIHLTIPRGNTGAIEGLPLSNNSPTALGTATPGTSESVSRADHVHPMPSAGDVGARPSTWTPTAADVGALPSNATAADSSKLGGKSLGDLMLGLYPVGSIYMSADATSPASIFGGTWQSIEDTFLLAAGSSYAAGTSGGEATHTLTLTEMPAHSHAINFLRAGAGDNTTYYGRVDFVQNTSDNAYETSSNGGGGAHNNMPPYLAVYMWKRVA